MFYVHLFVNVRLHFRSMRRKLVVVAIDMEVNEIIIGTEKGTEIEKGVTEGGKTIEEGEVTENPMNTGEGIEGKTMVEEETRKCGGMMIDTRRTGSEENQEMTDEEKTEGMTIVGEMKEGGKTIEEGIRKKSVMEPQIEEKKM